MKEAAVAPCSSASELLQFTRVSQVRFQPHEVIDNIPLVQGQGPQVSRIQETSNSPYDTSTLTQAGFSLR